LPIQFPVTLESRVASLIARGIAEPMAASSSFLRLGLIPSKSSISALASSIDSTQPGRGSDAGENSNFNKWRTIRLI